MSFRLDLSGIAALRRAVQRLLRRTACGMLCLLTSCTSIPYEAGTRANVARGAAAVAPTPASQEIGEGELPQDVFIGIAMSGGGSRAANFSAAVLLELSRMGLLHNAAAISSVSGSSLTAVYYGMHGSDKARWNEASVRQMLTHDFIRNWTVRWLYPHNIARYWLTPFDRSDIMKSVFDDVIFDSKTFKDLVPPGHTRILINATAIAGGENFVFSDQSFEELGSRLDSYPVSHAVMASAAFPAAFNSVTLEDYSKASQAIGQRFYKHLYDGGPSGNLGVDAIVALLRKTATRQTVKGCLLVLADAYPLQQAKIHKGQNDRDLRSLWSYVVDANVMDAFDDLLRSQRLAALRAIGYPWNEPVGARSTWEYKFVVPDGAKTRELTCHVWHLTMQESISPGFDPQITEMQQGAKTAEPISPDELSRRALSIATDFRLVHPALGDPIELQELLFRVAKNRVRANESTVMNWLRNWDLPLDLPAR